jgi:hypothetical protein
MRGIRRQGLTRRYGQLAQSGVMAFTMTGWGAVGANCPPNLSIRAFAFVFGLLSMIAGFLQFGVVGLIFGDLHRAPRSHRCARI